MADERWLELPPHDVAMATVRRFAQASGAVRVMVLLDAGEGQPAPLIECEPGSPVTITSGDETYLVPDEILDAVAPLEVEAPPPVPATAIAVDAAAGSIEAPLGAVARLAAGMRALARALGGRSVASADFATRGSVDITIAARAGDPLVVAIGDEQFELPDDAL